MSEATKKTHADFALPPSVVSKVDVSRLVSELEKIDNDLTTTSIRAGIGVNDQVTPTLSPKLKDFLVLNKLMLKTAKERSELLAEMRALKDTIPVINMTFAVEADSESLGQLAQWLRTSIHPQAVIAVGLQPGLIAGVYLRTPNHVHDLSMRAALKSGRELLAREIGALNAGR